MEPAHGTGAEIAGTDALLAMSVGRRPLVRWRPAALTVMCVLLAVSSWTVLRGRDPGPALMTTEADEGVFSMRVRRTSWRAGGKPTTNSPDTIHRFRVDYFPRLKE